MKPWLTLLRPHTKALSLGLLAVIGETIADLLQPWTLKIVFDNVLKSRPAHEHGWLNRLVLEAAGQDPLAILRFAAIAALAIAVFGAACSYTEKYLTTSVGQWVMHDLRRTLYSHVQRLSLSYHDHKQTGDLISRVTSDIDAIQSFIASGVLGAFINGLTLVGMVGVMFYINWRFTLVALSVAPGKSLCEEKLRTTAPGGRKPGKRRNCTTRPRVESQAFTAGGSHCGRGHKYGAVVWCAHGLAGKPFRRFAHRLHSVSRQDVQAHAGTLEDDRCLFEGVGRPRAYSGDLGDTA